MWLCSNLLSYSGEEYHWLVGICLFEDGSLKLKKVKRKIDDSHTPINYQLCFASMGFLSNIERLATQDELRQKKEEELDDYASQVNLHFDYYMFFNIA